MSAEVEGIQFLPIGKVICCKEEQNNYAASRLNPQSIPCQHTC